MGRPVPRKASTGRFRLSRFAAVAAVLGVAVVALATPRAARTETGPGIVTAAGSTAELVVTDIGRPIQLAFDPAGRLLVLGHGRRGDAAGEIHRFDVTQPLPIDAEHAPRVLIPF